MLYKKKYWYPGLLFMDYITLLDYQQFLIFCVKANQISCYADRIYSRVYMKYAFTNGLVYSWANATLITFTVENGWEKRACMLICRRNTQHTLAEAEELCRSSLTQLLFYGKIWQEKMRALLTLFSPATDCHSFSGFSLSFIASYSRIYQLQGIQ